MRIKPAVYEQLTPPQRLVAMFEAQGRNDKDEVRKLFQTCPKKSYRVVDPIFGDSYDRILDLTMSVEYILVQLALGFMLADKYDREKAPGYLEAIGSFDGAWIAYLEEKGISRESIRGILPRNRTLAALIEKSPPPDPDTLPALLAEFKADMLA